MNKRARARERDIFALQNCPCSKAVFGTKILPYWETPKVRAQIVRKIQGTSFLEPQSIGQHLTSPHTQAFCLDASGLLAGKKYPTLYAATRLKRPSSSSFVGISTQGLWWEMLFVCVRTPQSFSPENDLVSFPPANKLKNLFLRRRSRMLHDQSARSSYKWSIWAASTI
jgi:hypothetical protein